MEVNNLDDLSKVKLNMPDEGKKQFPDEWDNEKC